METIIWTFRDVYAEASLMAGRLVSFECLEQLETHTTGWPRSGLFSRDPTHLKSLFGMSR